MNRNIIAGDLKAFGQFQLRPAILFGKINVKDPATFVAMKMAMLVHIWAIAHGRAIEVHFFDQAALHQKIQTVVNRGHGNIGQTFLGAHKNLFGCGMIAFLEEHLIDMLSLRSQAKSFQGQPLHQGGFDCFAQTFHIIKIAPLPGESIVGIILNLIKAGKLFLPQGVVWAEAWKRLPENLASSRLQAREKIARLAELKKTPLSERANCELWFSGLIFSPLLPWY